MIEIEQVLYRPAYKGPYSQTAIGKFNGKRAIIKTGDSHLNEEKKILDTIDYPAIPKAIDLVAEDDEKQHLILEYFPGRPLSSHIELDSEWDSRKLSIDETYAIVDSLAKSLLVLKSKGYLYRDLNLEHVLLNQNRIYLVDLEGCVRQESPGEWRVNSRSGTWETMAPEEFEVGNRLSEATGTYMLGVLALQLTLGDNPFFISQEKIPDGEARRKATLELHEALPEINSGNKKLDAFLTKALQPEPKKRFEKIEDFQAALAKLTGHNVG